ncbi:hypothetical protein, partial [Shinella zoogloeoides]|uniref:hypothetical protein n=1 Tax=Shinella zoogloeoides TaxID=352475 RepID=UPI00196915B3
KPEPVRPNSHQLLKETLERVRRPPEAPPLSFDERRYRPNILGRQQACDSFLKFSSEKCVWLSFTRRMPWISGHSALHSLSNGPIALRISHSPPLEE